MVCRVFHSFRDFLRDDAGGSTVLALFWFMLFVAFGGLAVDVTDAFRVQTMMQATADSSAHAAVIDLPNQVDAINTAMELAETNMPSAQYGLVLSPSDVEIGVWDPAARTFIAGGASPNAVRVTVRSTEATGNPVPTNLLRIAGFQTWNISVSAIAAYSPSGDCFDKNGFIAAGYIHTGSENDYYGVCIHGEDYVKVGSTNNFYPGTQVSMPNTNDLEEGSDNYRLHPEFPDGALLQQSKLPPLVSSVPDIISGLADPNYEPSTTPPNFLTNTVYLNNRELPSTLVSGTLYVVSGDKEPVIQSDAVVNNVGIVYTNPNKPIKVGSKVKLTNVLLAGRGDILVGSENQIGATNFCTTGQGSVFIFTESMYDAGSQTDYTGVQIVAMGDAKLGSQLTSGGKGPEALSVQSGGDIYWGSQEVFRAGCDAPSFLAATGGRLAIVD
jgi:hypothetical protein